MKKQSLLFWIFLGVYGSLSAQEVVWKAGIHSFFDNTEFSGASVQTSQTMAGVHLAPEIGLTWNQKHRIYAGIDAMHEFGSDKAIDYYNPILYYEYTNKSFRFQMGAFPRQPALDKYPRMFFQDSIKNYRPVLNGFFWEYTSNGNQANVWLDWTGRQTRERNESFFMGWSGRYNWKLFYAQHFGYMFHYAKVKEPETDESVHDNGLLLTSLGIDLAEKMNFEKLEVNAGWSMGLDRDRSAGVWNRPQGFLSEIKVEYKGVGLFNTYYKGESQQAYYGDHSNGLYWGDPVYRSKEYDRVDLYIQFIKTSVVNLKFVYSFHFVEKQTYHEQLLSATFDLDNLKGKTKEKKYNYLWDNWFN
ncbi:MAG: hypothetical protein LBO74_14980 [Candidatus Symbiothrix sp.]|jgi:hypothetical protein|nr:hypothetical protein [Candidatus Symbiothrix sp.]